MVLEVNKIHPIKDGTKGIDWGSSTSEIQFEKNPLSSHLGTSLLGKGDRPIIMTGPTGPT